MHQEVLRRNVLRVLRIWRSWFIFSDDFLNGLQVILLASAFQSAMLYNIAAASNARSSRCKKFKIIKVNI